MTEFINRETGVEPDIHESVTVNGLVDCIHKITIDKDAFFGHDVMLLTGSHDYNYFGEQRKLRGGGGPITIGEGAWIASRAIIIGPCRIGKHAVIGAGSVVTHDVDDYCMVAGNPARIIKRYNHQQKKWDRVNI